MKASQNGRRKDWAEVEGWVSERRRSLVEDDVRFGFQPMKTVDKREAAVFCRAAELETWPLDRPGSPKSSGLESSCVYWSTTTSLPYENQ